MTGISSILGTAAELSAHGVRFAPEIATAAAKYDLDARLLAAVAAQETGGPGSNGGRNVVGDGGHGHGIFQIDDRYHAFARGAQAMQPQANADYAAGLLAALLRRYGNVHRALSAYNAGSPDARGTVTDWQDGRRLGYADSVLRHYADLGGTPAAEPSPSATPQFESLLDELQGESNAPSSHIYSYRAMDAHHTSPAELFASDDDS